MCARLNIEETQFLVIVNLIKATSTHIWVSGQHL